MVGLGASGKCTFTPAKTGTVLLTANGYATMTTATVNTGLSIRIAWGTTTGGSGPASKAAATGSTSPMISEWTASIAPTAAGDVHEPLSTQWLVSGLTVGTQYWADLQLAGITGASNCTLNSAVLTAVEIG
jgi:hypothetical protein